MSLVQTMKRGKNWRDRQRSPRLSIFDEPDELSQNVLLSAAHSLEVVIWDAVLDNHRYGEPELLRPYNEADNCSLRNQDCILSHRRPERSCGSSD